MAEDKITDQFNTFIDEKYIPLDIKIKAGICIAAILLPIVAFYYISFANQIKKINGLQTNIERLNKAIDKGKKAKSDLKRMKAEMAKIEDDFKKAAIVLPKTKEIPALLRNISDLGKEAGLDFISFKPGAEIPKEFYAVIPVNIKIKGPYHNLGYFLDRVSKLERIVSADNIAMGGAKKQGAELLLNSSCRLETYRFTGVRTQKNKKHKRR